jgi:SAM-dependent methyltransferase
LKVSVCGSRSLLFLLLSITGLRVYCQDKTENTAFVPYVGQSGKDVVWVPTPSELVDKMLDIAGVTENDFLIDLGSGDGRMVIAAAKLGAKAIGIEYNARMVEISKKKAEDAGVSQKTEFIQADLFEYDLSKATVITMFLLPDINLRLRPRLLNLRPGTRIVSNTFTMGDWEPDFESMTDGNLDSWYTALMWVIPAKAEGIWYLGPDTLTIYQEFQMIYGTLRINDKTSIISEGRLNGDIITFNVNGTIYTGRITGATSMSGTYFSGSSTGEWSATR